MDTPVAIAARLPVEISDWTAAPFDLKGETVFAIGDVHGCADELRVAPGHHRRIGARKAAASGGWSISAT